jgi:hypothetical protein
MRNGDRPASRHWIRFRRSVLRRKRYVRGLVQALQESYGAGAIKIEFKGSSLSERSIRAQMGDALRRYARDQQLSNHYEEAVPSDIEISQSDRRTGAFDPQRSFADGPKRALECERSTCVSDQQCEVVGHDVLNSMKQCLRPDGVPDGDLIQMWQVAEDLEVIPVQIVAGIDAESDLVC